MTAKPNCPRCGTPSAPSDCECPGCGMPAVFMGAPVRAPVVEPEVLDSLDEFRAPDPSGGMKPLGCTFGPGCGCLGIPIAAVVGLVVSSVVALAWVLRIGRMLAAVAGPIFRTRGGSADPRGTGKR